MNSAAKFIIGFYLCPNFTYGTAYVKCETVLYEKVFPVLLQVPLWPGRLPL